LPPLAALVAQTGHPRQRRRLAEAGEQMAGVAIAGCADVNAGRRKWRKSLGFSGAIGG
jgi:hypothetical protein